MKESPLRIAMLSPLRVRIPPSVDGEAELVIKLLIDELVARGHDVTLFATADCTTPAKLHPVCEVNLSELIMSGGASAFEHYANALMTAVLRRASEFDVIHSHLDPAWLPSAALSPAPVLLTMHTVPTRDDEWAMRHYPEVTPVGVSEHQMHATGLHLGRKFPVVYNGCDFDSYDALADPGEYLAFVGAMSPRRNPRDAIRIAQAVGMPIILAGRPQNADDERYFAQEVKPLIDGKDIRWIGSVNHLQKNELLRRAAALVVPMQWDEPFGLVMVEAMACGCPVVAHRRGSVAEVVDNGITGFHTGVIDAMAELLPSALNLDRRVVREHAEKRFGFRSMVDSYVALYRQLAARR